VTALGARILEIDGRRIERALRDRVRYRYVRPQVRREAEGWRIVSPCCSRNVDTEGGMIDIALLQPVPAGWRLYARDHEQDCWHEYEESDKLYDLLDAICLDPLRVFWP
jgi:hypothetical protein